MAFTNQFDTTGGGVPGMGDAFITTPISGIDPIAQIIQNGAQRRQEREKQRQEQLKQQEDIFKGINLGSDKYWVDKDAEYFHGPEGAVPKLLEEVKKAYIAGNGKLNPLDYAKFQQSISKLQADAAQSLKDRDVYTKSIEAFRNPKSNYDVDKSLELANGFAGAPLGQRDVNNLAGVAKQIDPIQHLNKNFGPAILKNIAPYVKVFDDKDQQAKAQEQIDGTYAAWKPGMISSLVAQGMEPDEALKAVEDYGATIRGNAGYTDRLDKQQTLDQDKLDWQKTYQKNHMANEDARTDIMRQRLTIAQQLKDLQISKSGLTGNIEDPTGVVEFSQALATKTPEAISRLNSIPVQSIETDEITGKPKLAYSNNDAHVVKGSELSDTRNQFGDSFDPNKEYIVVTYNAPISDKGNKLIIPVGGDDNNVKTITQSLIARGYNDEVLHKKNTRYNNPNDAYSNNKSGSSSYSKTQKSSSSKQSGSVATVNKNVIYSKSKSGKPIYSEDGGKTWKYK